jgi:ribosomal protein S2
VNSWDIICKVKATVPDNENGWRAIDLVWALLDGDITRDEALEALEMGGVENPAALLEEVGACKSSAL